MVDRNNGKEGEMKTNVSFVMGIAFIALVVGMAWWASVGRLSDVSGPYPWWLPITVLGVCGFPFLMGYLAGKDSR